MPRDESANVGYRHAGMYRWLQERACRHKAATGDYDPRQYLVLPAAEWQRRKAESRVWAGVLLDERLKAGEPITVERWCLGGGAPPADAAAWLSDRRVKWVSVDSDDTITPAPAPRLSKR